MIPLCANWNIWLGKEVEGDTDVGVTTLFIRKLPSRFTAASDFSGFTNRGKYTRVWFCKEFKDWAMLQAIAKHFKTVCVEVNASFLNGLPKVIRENYTLYVKVDFGNQLQLKPGDFVCAGPAFHDEAFRVGTGTKVEPSAYLQDTEVKL